MKKENKKRFLSEIVLYGLLVLMGIIVMSFPAFGLINTPYYVGSLFYIYSFMIILTYFVERKEGDYELLFNALISVIAGTFMFTNTTRTSSFILGTGLLIFTLLMLINKGYLIYKQKNKDNYLWVIKFIVAFLLAFLGVLVIINLFYEFSIQTLLIGYYFISIGIMQIIEPLVYYYIGEKKLKKIIDYIVKEDDTTKEFKEKKPVVRKKTITKKKVVSAKPKTKTVKKVAVKKASTPKVLKKTTKNSKK